MIEPCVFFLETFDLTGWGNKLRALQSSYILSSLLRRPLYVAYPLYHNSFVPPEDVFFGDPAVFDSLSASDVFAIDSIDDLDSLMTMPILPRVIVTGKGYSFVHYLHSHYDLFSSHPAHFVDKCSSLFAQPSPRLAAAVNSIRGSSATSVVFQFREFVDSRSENKYMFKYFMESLDALLPTLSSFTDPFCCLRLFLSDSPEKAALMRSLVEYKYGPSEHYVDKKFVHTSFHSPLRRGSLIVAFIEVWRRFCQFFRFFIMHKFQVKKYPFESLPLCSSLRLFSPARCTNEKIHIVAVWYLIRHSSSVYSTHTSFISSAVFGSSADVYRFDITSRAFGLLSFLERLRIH